METSEKLAPSAITANPAEPFNVLVVDDNNLIRRVLSDLLTQQGCHVTTAENGIEALRVFRSQRFQIIITDWIMPEMDGLELCREIRQDPVTHGYTYIILLTSQDSKNDIIAGLEAGADEYLVKPIHQPELMARLRTAKRILELEALRERRLDEARALSLIDPLTGIHNRRFMEERLPLEIKRSYRYQRPLSIILAGLGNFEGLKRDHGYFVAEQMLRTAALALDRAIREEIDWIARWSENTFLILLPETTPVDALTVGRRLRIRMAQISVDVHGEEIKTAGLFGVVGFTASEDKERMTHDVLVDHATKLLTGASVDNPVCGIALR